MANQSNIRLISHYINEDVCMHAGINESIDDGNVLADQLEEHDWNSEEISKALLPMAQEVFDVFEGIANEISQQSYGTWQDIWYARESTRFVIDRLNELDKHGISDSTMLYFNNMLLCMEKALDGLYQYKGKTRFPGTIQMAIDTYEKFYDLAIPVFERLLSYHNYEANKPIRTEIPLEEGLLHRRQRDGTRFDDDTPLNIVLDFLEEQGNITRPDLYAFLDHLQNSIVNQIEQMRNNALTTVSNILTKKGWNRKDIDDRADEINDYLTRIGESLTNIVPVIRHSQAQAYSASHSIDLLQRRLSHIIDDTISGMLMNIRDRLYPSTTILDMIHEVIGGILQATETIRDRLLPLLWNKK